MLGQVCNFRTGEKICHVRPGLYMLGEFRPG
jgi:hypothetical protein